MLWTSSTEGSYSHLEVPAPFLSPSICLSSSGPLSHFLPTFQSSAVSAVVQVNQVNQPSLPNLEQGLREALLGDRLEHNHKVKLLGIVAYAGVWGR